MRMCDGIGQQFDIKNECGESARKTGFKEAVVEVADTGSARGANPDIIVSSHQFCEELADMNLPLIEVVNYTDVPYIEGELKKILGI